GLGVLWRDRRRVCRGRRQDRKDAVDFPWKPGLEGLPDDLRTLVPVLGAFLLRGEQHEVNPETGLSDAPQAHGWFGRLNARFNDGYIAVRTRYTVLLLRFLDVRKREIVLSGLAVSSAFVLLQFVSSDFLPLVDVGQCS